MCKEGGYEMGPMDVDCVNIKTMAKVYTGQKEEKKTEVAHLKLQIIFRCCYSANVAD